MRHLLALDWDTHEVRLAIAQRRSGRLVLEHAVAIPRTTREGAADQTPAQLATSVADTLAAFGVTHPRTLVAVGRASVELKFMSLPPAPPADLPEMARFQAQKEFNSLTDDWSFDFLPLKGSQEEPHELLAVAIAPGVLTKILNVCRSAGLKPRHAGLRPCAAASLLLRDRSAENAPIRLLVDLLDEEAELTAIADQRVVLIRIVRLPPRTETEEEREQRRRLLEAEIRRTIAAVHNQLGGSQVDMIHLCSDGQDKSAAAERLEQRLGIPTRVFDPLDQIVLGRELRRSRPEHAARFAPLVGMLLDDAHNVPPAIDFLHPRKAEEGSRERWKVATLAAIAAVLVVALIGVRTWRNLRALDAEIATVRSEVAGLQALLKRTAGTEKKVEQLVPWMSSDIVWIDELEHLSEKLPKAEGAMLTHVQLVPNSAGGSLLLQGRVDNHTTIEQLETQLRDDRHRVEPKMTQQDGADSRYPWLFKTSLVVRPASRSRKTSSAAVATKQSPPASSASTPQEPATPRVVPAAVASETSEEVTDNDE
jgi:Tfp pilus assembly PilM family ATPase